MKTGVSLDGMMELIKDWLGRHTEEKAMRIGGDLVTTFGRRRHVAILNSHLAAQSRARIEGCVKRKATYLCAEI